MASRAAANATLRRPCDSASAHLTPAGKPAIIAILERISKKEEAKLAVDAVDRCGVWIRLGRLPLTHGRACYAF